MTSLRKILECNRALRRELAPRLVAEKSRMLDAMRERHLAIESLSARTKQSAKRTTRRSKDPMIE